MKKKNIKFKFKYIFGPVQSWRLGRSLGVDLTPHVKKTCNFDCIYCQLGKTKKHVIERKVFVPTGKIIEEIKNLPQVKIDYITFSGCGEPTLAKNLGQVISQIKEIRKEPVAVITNSGIISRKDVQDDLLKSDVVLFKLDACSGALLAIMNNPARGIEFGGIIDGLKKFRSRYKGKFVLQLMFVEENKWSAKDMAVFVKSINPDEVQINTPTRRGGGSEPLGARETNRIKKYFEMFRVMSVYDKKKTEPVKESFGDAETRHPVGQPKK